MKKHDISMKANYYYAVSASDGNHSLSNSHSLAILKNFTLAQNE